MSKRTGVDENGHRKRWNENEDIFLLSFGWCVGIDFVAEHDLGRTGAAARKRLTWLRKNKPDLVKKYWVVEHPSASS